MNSFTIHQLFNIDTITKTINFLFMKNMNRNDCRKIIRANISDNSCICYLLYEASITQ